MSALTFWPERGHGEPHAAERLSDIAERINRAVSAARGRVEVTFRTAFAPIENRMPITDAPIVF